MCPKVFPQNDYVPGMEQFSNINIIRYNLQAELRANTPVVKAKAIVEFQIVDKGYDYGVFEIDRSQRGEENISMAQLWGVELLFCLCRSVQASHASI